MRFIKTTAFFLAIFITASVANNSAIAENEVLKVEPVTNHGKKWRIAMYEGGAFIRHY